MSDPAPDADITPNVAAIVIGRNEGARLIACLASLGLPGRNVARIVYVDSGSTDGSVAAARAAGAEVTVLGTDLPFTAARARNAGLATLGHGVPPDLVQFIDGDCEMRPGWIRAAATFMAAHPAAAAVSGRLRERFPEASVYNRMCDAEWDTPVGRARSCGGIAIMRWDALEAAGGFNPTLIAGEEPELCVRLRAAGGEIWRIDAEMALHDAAMTRFSQFWTRARRCGHAWAEGAALHGRAPESHGVAATRRALIWGLALPLAILATTLILGPWALLLALIYPAQIVRLALRGGGDRMAWERAALLTASKFAESCGVLEYLLNRGLRRRAELIEYK